MAASTGSPASRRLTKLTPLTTRPSLTSRQGIMRTLNIFQNSWSMIRKSGNRFSEEIMPQTKNNLGRGAGALNQRQRGRRIEPAVIERAPHNRARELLCARRKQRLD